MINLLSGVVSEAMLVHSLPFRHSYAYTGSSNKVSTRLNLLLNKNTIVFHECTHVSISPTLPESQIHLGQPRYRAGITWARAHTNKCQLEAVSDLCFGQKRRTNI